MSATKKNVYALMIGIDDYPIAHHRLRGCVNDMQAVKEYLETRFDKDNFNLNIKALENDQATRQNIVDGFLKHLTQAQEGDIAFIHYSGHGSQEPAPPEFWHEEPDKLNESMVCWDSRLPGGYDLVGKETSYLISKVAEKDAHVVVLFDCCHSGSGTRDVDGEIRSRMAEVGNANRKLEDYIGFNEYEITTAPDGTRQATPPRGRHILLAAAKDSETAKETIMDGKQGGVFTNSVLKVLNGARGSVSYAELMARVQTLVFNKVDEQHPQLESSIDENDKFKAFLDGGILPKPDYYTITYDEGVEGWVMDGGAMAGIPEPNGAATTELFVFDSNASDQDLQDEGKKLGTAKVIEVYPDKALLEIEGIGDAQEVSYKGKVSKLPIPKLQVFIDPAGEKVGVELAGKAIADSGSLLVETVDDLKKATYRVLCKGDQFYVTLPGEDKPLFKRIDKYNEDTGKILVQRLEHVAKWKNTFELYNPNTGFDGSEVEITMTEVTKFGQRLSVQEEKELNTSEPITLEYKFDGAKKKWDMPWFRMKIKNNSEDNLFVAMLYLGADFSVNTDYLPSQELRPGEEVYLKTKFKVKGKTIEKDAIPIAVPEEYSTWGTTEVNELFKVLVSTVQFNTTLYKQEGLELDVKDKVATRVAVGDLDDFGGFDDWTVHDIHVTTIRPLDSVEMGKEDVELQGVMVKAHPALSGKVNLASQKEATRAAGGAPVAPAAFDGNPNIQDVEFNQPIGKAAPLSVLELSDIADTSAVTSDQPLELKINTELAEGEYLLPIAYDSELDMFVPVGGADDEEGGTNIRIENLPTPTPAGTRSLGGSIKILFKRVVMEKIGFKSEYPILAEGVVSDNGEEIKYEKKMEHVKQRVAESNRIVVFIHGIIGDTKDMTKAVQKGRIEIEGKERKIKDYYDLVLTFDYENLGTTIQDNGRLFKKRLEEAGLGEGHGKTLHIIAHSMGGLVSRWMIEKEGGNKIVNHLIQLGTPNGGSEWGGQPRNWGKIALTTMMGKVTVVSPYLAPLTGFLKTFTNEMLESLGQMNPGSEFLKQLNDGTDPGIPYSIIYGNTSLVMHEWSGDWKSKMLKLLDKLKDKALEDFLFKSENDIAVRIGSIQEVPDDRNPAPYKVEVACDHMSYFTTDVGLQTLSEVMAKVNGGVAS